MNKQSLAVNALPVTHVNKKLKFQFYKEKGPNRSPLKRKEFPAGWVHENPEAAGEHDILYTDFHSKGKGDCTIEIDFDEAPALASHYYHKRLFAAFKDIADFREMNFIHRVKLWFRDPSADEDDFRAYKTFTLSTGRHWYTSGWGLSVQFNGHSYVYPHPMGGGDETLDTTDVSRIAYKGHIFHYEDIPEDKLHEIDFAEAFPVVNLDIRIKTGRFLTPDPFKNKVKEYYDEIDRFRREYLTLDQVQKALQMDTSSWVSIPDESARKVPVSGSKMVFRGGKTDINPNSGISRHGPFRPPKAPHIRFLFIMNHDDRSGKGEEFYQYLKGLKTYTYRGEKRHVHSLKKYINLGANLGRKYLYFTDDDNPFPEVADEIRKLEKEPGVTYLAFYISPIDKEERDPEKHLVYYRIKEELLKHGISSQVVERSTIGTNGFRYALPNIYVAVLAKLGGIPWQLSKPPEPELIVGIGAFKPKGFSRRYLGSAFCFRNNGTFMGLRCFAGDEPHMLAGSVREAVMNYVQENGDAKRLVIHFYKTMGWKERKPILDTLHELGLDIPVIVLTINKTEFDDTVLFDPDNPDKLPLSGTWFNRGRNDILLCNNTRYFGNSKIKKGFPFPVRVQMWCSDDDLLEDWKERQKLITQVYQFSRLYWKSVSQQNLPVTIKYPEMVAEMFPWFEGLTLPSFGRKNLWFL